MLRERLGAAAVSFVITGFTGGSVVRLGAAGSVDTGEPARCIPPRGTLYDDVIRTQRPSVPVAGIHTSLMHEITAALYYAITIRSLPVRLLGPHGVPPVRVPAACPRSRGRRVD
ncbi:hypothetical protein [Streptomyces beigongshangae]|uniref:hypothetical protein n=1 Tax=Streptomyces beigongshangae TaxID=2841597 RepID=UPI0021A745F3|nr:hypothetical protein [Streptomyces sp. REN17]